jgi:hypothetical protein
LPHEDILHKVKKIVDLFTLKNTTNLRIIISCSLSLFSFLHCKKHLTYAYISKVNKQSWYDNVEFLRASLFYSSDTFKKEELHKACFNLSTFLTISTYE